LVEFSNGATRDNPQRVGHQFRNDPAGQWSARCGSFRVIDVTAGIVNVVGVDHERAVYRLSDRPPSGAARDGW